MEYTTPETTLLQEQAANPILGNIFLLLAILLFLAILPRALRTLAQKKQTALDRTVERFEKEEMLTASVEGLNETNAQQETPTPPNDRSLTYIKEELPVSEVTQELGGIPPFPTQVEEEKKVKIVKEGVPISHNEFEEDAPTPEKTVKLVKQEIPVASDKSKKSPEKSPSEPQKGKPTVQSQKPKETAPQVSNDENVEADDNWVEAEIPGLIMDPPPPAAEKPENIPTFKASPKGKPQPETAKPQKSAPKEKQGQKVKNIASKTEKTKDSKPKQLVKPKADSLKIEMEISESKPKIVEIKAPIASHKNIVKKRTEQKKVKVSSAKVGEAPRAEPKIKAAPPQREDVKASPDKKARPKPFLLDLKYLDREELRTESSADQGKLPADMMDAVIARLNALQVGLENQLVSVPGELTASENPINGNMRKNQIEKATDDLSDKKEVSLEELDSFLFTSTQRKNRE